MLKLVEMEDIVFLGLVLKEFPCVLKNLSNSIILTIRKFTSCVSSMWQLPNEFHSHTGRGSNCPTEGTLDLLTGMASAPSYRERKNRLYALHWLVASRMARTFWVNVIGDTCGSPPLFVT